MINKDLHGYLSKLAHIFGYDRLEAELAEIYLDKAYEQNDQNEIDCLINKAVVLNPERTYLRFARYNRGRRRLDSAIDFYLKAFHANPTNHEKWFEISEYILRHGNSSNVKYFFSQLAALDPTNSEYRFILNCYDYYQELIRTITQKVNVATPQKKLLINWSYWGTQYEKILTGYHLPALLSPQNLPAVADQYDIHCIIVSGKHYIDQLEKNATIQQIKPYAQVHLIPYPEDLFSYVIEYQKNNAGWTIPSGLITNCVYYASLESARLVNAFNMTLYPDHIIPYNLLLHLLGKVSDDIDLVAGPIFRLYNDPELLRIIDERYRKENGIVEISNSGMIEFLMKFLPEQNYTDSNEFTSFPISICWKVGDEGLIASINHCAPWLIRGEKLNDSIELRIDPIDGFFLSRYLGINNNVAFLPDELICFDLGSNPYLFEIKNNTFSPEFVADFLSQYYTPVHDKYLQHPFLLKSNPILSENKWQEKAIEVNHALSSIKQLIYNNLQN